MAIQYRMSDPTNFRNSRFRNVEAREENAVSCEGTVSTYSFSRIDQTGTYIQKKATTAITGNVARIAPTRPHTGMKAPQITGAR